MKLSVTEKEYLGVIWNVEKLRHYMEGVHFKVTDHHFLLRLHTLKDPQGRLGRWTLPIQPCDFELSHREGENHIVFVFLSRFIPSSSEYIVAVNEIPSAFKLQTNGIIKCNKILTHTPKKVPVGE